MPFAHAWLALGALGGAIPVIIHLLNRRRFKILRWAAMEFLLASLKKNYKRVRIENLLLLLLRVLMIVLLALALARPRLSESGFLGALGTESRHAIVLLDDSYSMGYGRAAETCFTKAQKEAGEILGLLNKGDVVSLLAVSDVTRPIIKEATIDLDLVRNEIKLAKPGWGATDLRHALVAAAGLLDSTKRPRKEIFIITDMQALAWGTAEAEPDAELKAALDRIEKDAKVFVVDVGSGEPENTSVTGIEPVSSIIGTGSPSEFAVEVTNFGRSKRAGIEVSFLVDKFSQDKQEVNVEPGKTETVTFSHSFHTAGPHLVQAALSDDRLNADNIRHLAINVESVVPVLLVNGETDPEPNKNETYYVERAFRPPVEMGERQVSHVEPTVISEFGVSAADFGKYRLVVLANLASLATENAVPRLEDYVRNGGALIIFPGDRIDSAFYNEQLFKSGNGLLPARIGAEVGSTGSDKTGMHMELVSPVHPSFERFTGERAFFINRKLLFYKYLALELPANMEDIRVVARFEGGSPAIVEKTFGRGKVMLFASSCDTEWNNFARAVGGAVFPVVMHDILGHLVSGVSERLNVIVHHRYRRVFAPDELVETTMLRPPEGAGTEREYRPHVVRTNRQPAASGTADATESGFTEIVVEDTNIAGLYALELQRKVEPARSVEYFAVNVPPAEGNLQRCTATDAKAAVKGLTFKLAPSTVELRLAVRRSRSGREFARPLLLAVLAISCVELILGQRFGR